MDNSVKLGETYKDTVTGFKGTATAQCHYLSGCDHVMLEALVQGAVKELWFDVPRLKMVVKKKRKQPGVRSLSRAERYRGGPTPTPPGRSTPPQASAEGG